MSSPESLWPSRRLAGTSSPFWVPLSVVQPKLIFIYKPHHCLLCSIIMLHVCTLKVLLWPWPSLLIGLASTYEPGHHSSFPSQGTGLAFRLDPQCGTCRR